MRNGRYVRRKIVKKEARCGIETLRECVVSTVCLYVKQQAVSHLTPMLLLRGVGCDVLPSQGDYMYTVLTFIETMQQRSHR
jgi:hypothetical protein